MFPNTATPLSAVDEAVFLQNRQLLSQLQGHPPLAFGGQGANKPASQAPFFKPAQPLGLGVQNSGQTAASFLGLQAGQHQIHAAAANPIPGQVPLRGASSGMNPLTANGGGPAPNTNNPAAAGQAALVQAMLQQGQLTQQQQHFMHNSTSTLQAGAGYPVNSSIAAAAAAAATQQARAAQANQQATRVAVVNYLQQQQQQQQMAAAQQQHRQTVQQNAQNTAWLNAAVQRAVASGQLVIQNGKPVLVSQPMAQQQQAQQQQNLLGSNPHANAAAQIMQQLQAAQMVAAAAQKEAQHAQMVKQIQAVLAQQNKVTNQQAHAQAQASHNAAALLKQAQLQDALAAMNNRAGAAKGNVFPAAFPPQGASQTQAQTHAQAQQLIRQNMAALSNLTPSQLQALTVNLSPTQIQALAANPAFAQLILQARSNVSIQQQQQQQQMQQLQQQQKQQQMQQQMQMQQMQHQKQMQQQQQHHHQLLQQASLQASSAATAAPVGIPGAEALLNTFRQQPTDTWVRQQQQQPFLIPSDPSPASSTSGSPPTAANKEQRQAALACVAVQLAQQGISIDQAIHSGVMGGMSVSDVHFIMDVYNRHLKEQGAGGGASPAGTGSGVPAPALAAKSPADSLPSAFTSVPGIEAAAAAAAVRQAQLGALPPDQRPLSIRSASPAPSSCGGSEVGGATGARSRAASAVGLGMSADVAPDLGGPSSFDNDAFNAFTYGFFGQLAGGGGGGEGVDLLEELEGSGLEDSGKDGNGAGGNSDIPLWQSDGGLPEWGGQGVENGLQESGEGGGEDEDDPAWLHDEDGQAQGAAAQLAQVAGLPAAAAAALGLDQNARLPDDVAARLANLDLGSGFF